jgi:hypothetical protein
MTKEEEEKEIKQMNTIAINNGYNINNVKKSYDRPMNTTSASSIETRN